MVMKDRCSPGTCRSKLGRLLQVRPWINRMRPLASPAGARCHTATWCPSTTTSCFVGPCPGVCAAATLALSAAAASTKHVARRTTHHSALSTEHPAPTQHSTPSTPHPLSTQHRAPSTHSALSTEHPAPTQHPAPSTPLSSLLPQNAGSQRVERRGRPHEQLVGKTMLVGQHPRGDNVALIEAQTHAGGDPEAQVAVAIDRRVGQPRLQILRAPGERREEI